METNIVYDACTFIVYQEPVPWLRQKIIGLSPNSTILGKFMWDLGQTMGKWEQLCIYIPCRVLYV